MNIQLNEKINISVDSLKSLSEVDLADLCNITEQAINAGGGFGWLRVPEPEVKKIIGIKFYPTNLIILLLED